MGKSHDQHLIYVIQTCQNFSGSDEEMGGGNWNGYTTISVCLYRDLYEVELQLAVVILRNCVLLLEDQLNSKYLIDHPLFSVSLCVVWLTVFDHSL